MRNSRAKKNLKGNFSYARCETVLCTKEDLSHLWSFCNPSALHGTGTYLISSFWVTACMQGLLPSATETVCAWQESSGPLLDWQFSNLPRCSCWHSLCLRPQTGDWPKLGMDQGRTKDSSYCSIDSESSRTMGTSVHLWSPIKGSSSHNFSPVTFVNQVATFEAIAMIVLGVLFFCLINMQGKPLYRQLSDMIFLKLRPWPRWLQKSFSQPWRLRCLSELACQALQISLPHLMNVKLV